MAAVPPLATGNSVSMTRWGDQRRLRMQPGADRARGADRPFLTQGEIVPFSGVVGQHRNGIVYRIFAVRHHRFHRPGQAGRHHTFMGDNRGFRAGSVHHAGIQPIAGLHRDRNCPFFLLVECGHADPAGDEIAGFFLDRLERPLDAVKDIVENAGTERRTQRAAGRIYRLARPQPGCLLIHLNGGFLIIDADDLASEPAAAHEHHSHHLQAGIARQGDNRPVDALYAVIHRVSRLSVPADFPRLLHLCRPENMPPGSGYFPQ